MNGATQTLTLRQLEYVVAVADALSFRRAAETCHVSQPSLSAQLAQLEEALGVRLFERDRQRVLLTGPGQELVERARSVLREADDLVDAARLARDPLSGRIDIGVIPTVSPYLLPRVAPTLRAEYPKLLAVWVEDKTEALLRELKSGHIDAAILASDTDLEGCEHALIARDPFLLACAENHALAARKGPIKMQELKDESVLLLDDGHCFREQALAFCTRAKAKELEYRATSLPTLVQMVASGAGVTLLPELAATHEGKKAGLTLRRFQDPEPYRTLVLTWRKGSPLRRTCKTLAAAMKARDGHYT